MISTLARRLQRLEASPAGEPDEPARCHRLIVDGEDPDVAVRDLRAGPDFRERDSIIVRVIVHPTGTADRPIPPPAG
jgi:hypothetical protein